MSTVQTVQWRCHFRERLVEGASRARRFRLEGKFGAAAVSWPPPNGVFSDQ
jgi:hypothetical protein